MGKLDFGGEVQPNEEPFTDVTSFTQLDQGIEEAVAFGYDVTHNLQTTVLNEAQGIEKMAFYCDVTTSNQQAQEIKKMVFLP